MNEELLKQLSIITEEEKEILAGKNTVQRELYYRKDEDDRIDSSLVLQNGKLIDIRPHTRFLRFPKHTHNYVEIVYMVKGQTTHIIDNETIVLKEGDLLLLNQHAAQEIEAAGKDDIAVNFMILPQFFDDVFPMIASEESVLRDFIIACLTDRDLPSNYLYFSASDILPVQNLLENLIWNLLRDEPNRRSLNQVTMGLLFLSMISHSGEIRISERSYDQQITMDLLRYIDSEYRTASLTSFADERNVPLYTLSRIIRKQTGKTFRELLETKRMNQSVFLLKNTYLPVEEISAQVGYENLSFFYRLFKKTCGMTPGEYRSKQQHETENRTSVK